MSERAQKDQWLAFASNQLANLGGLLLVIATAVAFTNVITRNLFSYPFSWSDELVGFLSVWAVYLPLTLMERTNGHLRVTVVYDLCQPTVRKLLDRVHDLISMTMLFYLGYVGLTVVRSNLALGASSPTLNIPLGLLYAVVPVSFALAALSRLLALGSGLFLTKEKGGAE